MNSISVGYLGEVTTHFKYLVQANDHGDHATTIALKYCVFGFPITTIGLAILSAIACIITRGSIDVNYLYKPHKLMYLLPI